MNCLVRVWRPHSQGPYQKLRDRDHGDNCSIASRPHPGINEMRGNERNRFIAVEVGNEGTRIQQDAFAWLNVGPELRQAHCPQESLSPRK